MQGMDGLGPDSHAWASLFPGEDGKDQPTTEKLAQSFNVESPSTINPQTITPAMSRNTSSPGKTSSRGSQQGRQSSTSGVVKRRVKSDLPPIVVENRNDTAAMKRARNTMAARKSRDRRATHIEELETLNARLQAENAELTAQVEHWKSVAKYNGRTD